MKIESIKNTEIVDSLRFDGSYHLAEGNLFLRKIKTMPYKELGKLCEDIFTSGRRKRVYTKKEKGYPYLSNSDVVKINPFDNCNYNSKKYGYDETAFLKEGMIVTGRVGAIGQTAYITSEYEEKKSMGSDNIIRIVCKEKNKQGYIYSFLASKVGTSLIQRLAAGGVQPYISDKMLIDLPIPLLSEQKQKEIHQLIVEASELRVEANKLLEEAHNSILENIKVSEYKKSFKKSISDILKSHQVRFEAEYHKNIGSYYRDEIYKMDFKFLKDISERVFRPGIFKRNYLENGSEFLGGSDITRAIPSSDKKLHPNSTPNFNELTLEKNWILVTCGGTIGTSVLVGKYLSTKLASQHILRVIPKNIPYGYLFAYLSSFIGQEVIKSFTYGSVIPQIEPHHLELVPIPIIEENIMNDIHEKVVTYKNNIDTSIELELNAISLIEKEIDTWQQS